MCSRQRYHTNRESHQSARMITAADAEVEDAALDARVADEAADEAVEVEPQEQSQRRSLPASQERYHPQREGRQQEAVDSNPT